MTIQEHAPSSEPFWLHLHQTEFLHSLAEQGLSKHSLDFYRRQCRRLCDLAEVQGISSDKCDIAAMHNLAETCPATGAAQVRSGLTRVMRRFTAHLIDAGVIVRPEPSPPPGGSVESLCIELDSWLRSQRGAYGYRLQQYPKVLKGLVSHCCRDTGTLQDLASATPEDVLGYMDRITGTSNWRIHYLRTVLRFLFWSARMPRDLSAIIPPMGRIQTDGMPRHLDPETVDRLLEASRGESPRDKRGHAMLLIMARLGLRAQEVVAMRLEDMDWQLGRMRIRGKRGQTDHMPIPVDVGEAVVSWLREGRRGQAQHLFVSLLPPFAGLSSSRPVHDALERAWRRAELPPPQGQLRTHALRHSLAMDLLNRGSSLEEIANVLRHRSMSATTTYARHDVEKLRELARPWPDRRADR